jgi:DNA (cytosine-5)-methyltransferase 1
MKLIYSFIKKKTLLEILPLRGIMNFNLPALSEITDAVFCCNDKHKMPAIKKTQAKTFVDLFAGIGGFHIALHELGIECVFASESDKEARKTYELNHGKYSKKLFETGNFAGDITTVKPNNIPDFDILCAGFPCQPFSQAGFKKGFDEVRGTLFFDIANIIKIKQPKAFFLENVRHLLKHNNGKTFKSIKNIIENELGYSFYYKIVKASDFGLPQHRPRLFMVGFKDKTIDFEFPKPIPLKKTMADIWNAHCEKQIGYTLRVGGRGSGLDDRRNWDTYLVDGKAKRIGVEEGKKMMGLPNDFTFPVSSTQAMKQLGNGVAVPAIKATAQKIIEALQNND